MCGLGGLNSVNIGVIAVSVVVLFIILSSMMLLVVHVFRVERRLDRYLSEGQLRNHRNTMKTAWQGIWYTLGEKSLQRMYVDLLQAAPR